MDNIENKPVPLVSISVITYNHEKYVRQCLEGILMQSVNFPYEVLVHDDASPDGTADIIREYETKHPGTIRPICQSENQYSQGKPISRFNWDRARGKYLAFCEGDDYWTDSRKLQKQVDFLEAHPEYIACVHRVQVVDEFGDINQSSWFARNYCASDYTLSEAEDFLIGNGCAGHLSSLVCRNIFRTLPEGIYENFLNCKANEDTKLSLLLTLNGPIRRFDDTMSTYRHVTSNGTSWSARHAGIQNTCLLNYSRLKELSSFSQGSYGFIPNYTDYEDELTLMSIYKYMSHPSRDNKDIMYKLLNETDNKYRLMRHIIRFSYGYLNNILESIKEKC